MMSNTAAVAEPSVHSLTATETITFEQPLNEAIRICLRLETLFNTLRNHLHPHAVNTEYGLYTLLNILNVVDRPDIRSKISQSLTQYAGGLAQLRQFPHVDQTKLQIIIRKIDHLNKNLHQHQHKIGDNLKNNTFLNGLRLQLTTPSGIAKYKNPALRLWLEQSPDNQLCDLKEWAEAFRDLNSSVVFILELIRQSSTSKDHIARDGFYQQTLNPTLPVELVRITLGSDLQVYPEVSVGKHRISLRFVGPQYFSNGQPQQTQADVPFTLTCCRV